MGYGSESILVVDDQLGVRILIQEVFQDTGYRVLTASHGQEALAHMAVEVPSLVLLDMKMPVMDGLETLRAIKATYPRVVVFIMTAVEEAERIADAMALGAARFVGKPFDVFELRELVVDRLRAEGGAQ